MENATNRLLFESIIRTLHSQSFSRTSNQTCTVLADLLTRYLRLLALTCATHASHAGRTDLTAQDVVASLEELGVTVAELKQFQEVEGKDLARYAYISQRRRQDLYEMKTYLIDGLFHDPSDSQHLVYERLPTPESEPGYKEEEEREDINMINDDVPISPSRPTLNSTVYPPMSSMSKPPAIALPPSPISNPPSPGYPRKRSRVNNWEPPDHVPDFLPPFPAASYPTPEEMPAADTPQDTSQNKAPTPLPDRPLSPSPPPTQPGAKASYLSSVPYESSTISTRPTSHLPRAPEKLEKDSTNTGSLVHFSLLKAQHHLLTNPPPDPSTQIPSRHTLALGLLQSSRARYGPPDSLFASSEPNRLRLSAPTPNFAVANSTDEQKRPMPHLTRAFMTGEPLAALASQQTSRIPSLARFVLQEKMHQRLQRLPVPPAQQRDSRKLLYGPGIPAPWNAASAEKAADEKGKKKESKTSDTVAKLPDSTMFATWDWESKDFRAPLPPRRARGGTLQGGSLNPIPRLKGNN